MNVVLRPVRPTPAVWARFGVALSTILVLAFTLFPNRYAVNRLFVEVYVFFLYWLGVNRSPEDYHAAAHVLAFVVTGVLLVLAWPRVRAVWWLVVLATFSATAQYVKHRLIPEEGDLNDVLLNVAGAVVGVLIGVGWRRLRERRRSIRQASD